jgi:hypothetical protein
MIKTGILVLLLFFTGPGYGQREKSLADFKADFTKALDSSFSEKQLNKIMLDYTELLEPNAYAAKPAKNFQENITWYYPLQEFKKEQLYAGNINTLLASQNMFQRMLAYQVIGASFDTSQEHILLNRIVTEKEEGNLTWAGMALLYLQCSHTTALFDFLVKNEDFGDAHMLPFYMRLNKDSLLQTAYKRINNPDTKSKILAAQMLSIAPLNATTTELLMSAVKNWDMDIKGYAIYSVKELRMGNLLETFKPLLNDKRTRSISLQALANSPSKADKDFLYGLINQQDTVSTELLDCLYTSKNIDNLTWWLSLLYTRKLPVKYNFFVFEQPLVRTDSILSHLQMALQKITNKNILGELVRALENRGDNKTVEIIKTLLKHKNSTVRYWTAKTAENNQSAKFREAEMSKLIKAGLKDGNTPDD